MVGSSRRSEIPRQPNRFRTLDIEYEPLGFALEPRCYQQYRQSRCQSRCQSRNIDSTLVLLCKLHLLFQSLYSVLVAPVLFIAWITQSRPNVRGSPVQQHPQGDVIDALVPVSMLLCMGSVRPPPGFRRGNLQPSLTRHSNAMALSSRESVRGA